MKKKISSLDEGLNNLGDTLNRDFLQLIKLSTEKSEEEDFSLMLDETLKGKDIRIQYPLFYAELERNDDLRQRFIDALTLLDADKLSTLFSLETKRRIDSPPFSPIYKIKNSVSSLIRRSTQELQAIFFPIEPVFRDSSLTEELTYILLNEEITVESVTYSIEVDGIVSRRIRGTLQMEVFLAIAKSLITGSQEFPVDLMVTWGNTSKVIRFNEEGKYHLANVPLREFLDSEMRHVITPMEIRVTRST